MSLTSPGPELHTGINSPRQLTKLIACLLWAPAWLAYLLVAGLFAVLSPYDFKARMSHRGDWPPAPVRHRLRLVWDDLLVTALRRALIAVSAVFGLAWTLKITITVEVVNLYAEELDDARAQLLKQLCDPAARIAYYVVGGKPGRPPAERTARVGIDSVILTPHPDWSGRDANTPDYSIGARVTATIVLPARHAFPPYCGAYLVERVDPSGSPRSAQAAGAGQEADADNDGAGLVSAQARLSVVPEGLLDWVRGFSPSGWNGAGIRHRPTRRTDLMTSFEQESVSQRWAPGTGESDVSDRPVPSR